MKQILLLSLIFLYKPGLGQNLVPNPSFEDVNICTEFNTSCGPSGWFFVNHKSPGYGNSKLSSADGNKHLTLMVIDANSEIRHYWQTRLLCPLQAGESYKVKFMLTSPSKMFSVRDIGFLFSNSMTLAAKDTLLQSEDYLSFADAKVKKLKNGWQEVQMDFVPSQNFTRLIIGNFSNETNQQLARKNKMASRWSYIAIDDVSISSKNSIQCEGTSKTLDSLYAIKSRHSAKNLLPSIKPTNKAPNDTIVIENIEFDFDSSVIKNEESLTYLLQYLTSPSIKSLKVVGFTDNSGTAEYNSSLSLRRANSVAAYLKVKLRIRVPIEVEGKGISDKYSDPQRNRRVEIWIYR